MTTSTFGIPGSPGSCCSLLLTSSNTIPVTVPVDFGVGAGVGVTVGEGVGRLVGFAVGLTVGDAVGALVGESVGNWKPSLSVAVPPSGTTTVVGSLPPVCAAPLGNVR